MPEPKSPFKRARKHFDRDTLKRVCEMHETDFAAAYGMTVEEVDTLWDNMQWNSLRIADYPLFYAFKDNGSDILAVAHLDTCVKHEQRVANFIDTAGGPVVYSGALDDRLGAYTILELLPRLGINVDVLLTTGEEDGMSTAEHFTPPRDKDYKWVIEFDRGGTDVVMYQYEDDETYALVRESGARVGQGSFSDIAYLEHLGVKAFNWGVGYRDYHGPRGHAFLEDYWEMVAYFIKFHAANQGSWLPHEERRPERGSLAGLWGGGGKSSLYSDYAECLACGSFFDLMDVMDERCWDEQVCESCVDVVADRDQEPGPDDVDPYADDLESEDFNLVNQRLLAIEGVTDASVAG